MTSTPKEQIAQEAERAVPPLIGEVRAEPAETVHSSTTGSSTSTNNSRATSIMLRRQEEQEENEFWDDIIDIMYTMFNDEIDADELLHEG
eukprot:3794859-Amphidinium_carterae.1